MKRNHVNGPAIHCAHSKIVPLDKLKEHPANPNTHPPEQIALLAKIIKQQGWRNPIVVSNRSQLITKGHARLYAARALSLKSVPVDFQDYKTEKQELADMVADNRIAELAELDRSGLREIMEQLDDGAFDMDLTGFDQAALEELMTATAPESDVDAEPQIDKADELRKKWGVERGQIWELGEHRLMCGSSVESEAFEQLFNGDQLRLVWTDPPYGVSYGAKNEFLNAISRGNRIQTPIKNDQEKPEEIRKLFTEALRLACDIGLPGASVYASCPAGMTLGYFIQAINDSGFNYMHGLVWIKNQFVLGRSDYHYRHEMVLYGWKKGAHYFISDSGLDSVFEIPKPRQSDKHPTTKPTELVRRCVNNSSKPDEIVYDPFHGSGTTLMACEQLHRKCRAMEIDPGYVAVSLQRFLDATGKMPKLVSNG